MLKGQDEKRLKGQELKGQIKNVKDKIQKLKGQDQKS